ncbi:OmpA family protein [Rhizobium sp. TRM95111]|uniref:OmpA family protein n=1 Tax=Rhizobium alarense TaxID=2846851 RepID=UPI001F1DB348|nr:OmpA family protein [Rhizobium alarense]MCF3643138.1 OmpA family protein [Rhizobium alarense]
MRKLAVLSCVALLAACSTPPKPPKVSGWHRSPVNSEAAVQELQLQVFPPAPVDGQAVKLQGAMLYAQTVSVHFPWNHTAFHPSEEQARQLRALLANGVDYVSVRGRTDGKRPAPGDESVARRRAEAARDWLIGQGVPANRIYVNYVSAGDYVSNNRVSSGRALNRRVDIEIVRR